MRRVAESRDGCPDLLTRRPSIDRSFAVESTARGISVVDQLHELADLYDRGLLDADELLRQQAKVFS